MNLTDHLLATLGSYGLPVLFAVVAISAVGVPFPVTLMLVAAGSFVQLGQMNFWEVITVASSAAVLGDQIGYSIGRKGGRRLAARIERRKDGRAIIAGAAAFTKDWGGAAIFFSRWLVTPLGPWLNLTSGIAGYPWTKFLCWDVVGEILWVVLYVMIGKVLSDRVQALVEILGNLAWVIIGLIVTILLGWQLLRHIRPSSEKQQPKVSPY